MASGDAYPFAGLLSPPPALETLQLTFEPIYSDDLMRVRQIMAFYANADLDFVDCCLMALAERLNVKTIATFDRRDFSIMRPSHCDYFNLLPQSD